MSGDGGVGISSVAAPYSARFLGYPDIISVSKSADLLVAGGERGRTGHNSARSRDRSRSGSPGSSEDGVRPAVYHLNRLPGTMSDSVWLSSGTLQAGVGASGNRGSSSQPRASAGHSKVSRSLSGRSHSLAHSGGSTAVVTSGGQGTGDQGTLASSSAAMALGLKEKKLGHRRVTDGGEVTYKKFETTQLMGSMQLGIQHAVGGLANVPQRDLLMMDFLSIDSVNFTRDGLVQKTPAHNYSEFRFRTYAAFAFRTFRKLFSIETDLFLASLCSEPMIELSNPGVSGSIFYVTTDDNFICKTVQHKEAEFLQKLLPGYYLNLQQNQRTLLPKFFGLYCYSCNAKNVRIVVMNNLLPSGLRMHHRFDLKGSTYKRKASRQERAKDNPTYKDLDFLEMYPEGIILQHDIHHSLMNSIQRDCRVLESFKIMDYSLLIGIHNLDQAARDKDHHHHQHHNSVVGGPFNNDPSDWYHVTASDCDSSLSVGVNRVERQGSLIHRERMIAHSTALESITMDVDGHGGVNRHPNVLDPGWDGASSEGYHPGGGGHRRQVSGDSASMGGSGLVAGLGVGGGELAVESGDMNNVWGGIPAKNHRGENLLLFIGIIDILQSYGVLKKVEHYWKSLIHDGDTVSVHRPGFYALRFQQFMEDRVFKKMLPLNAVRPSLSVKRSNFRRNLSTAPPAGQPMTTTSGGGADSGSNPNPAAMSRQYSAPGLEPPGHPVRGDARVDQQGVVTVITVVGSPSTAPEVHLPPVLQDRKARVSSVGGGTSRVDAAGSEAAGPDSQDTHRPTTKKSKDTTTTTTTTGTSSPSAVATQGSGQGGGGVEGVQPEVVEPSSEGTAQSPPINRYLGLRGAADDPRVETGSIITMTSDERVQIYVPSPSGSGTPYGTITKGDSINRFNRTPLLQSVSGDSSGLSDSRCATPSVVTRISLGAGGGQQPHQQRSSTDSGRGSPSYGGGQFPGVGAGGQYRSVTPLNVDDHHHPHHHHHHHHLHHHLPARGRSWTTEPDESSDEASRQGDEQQDPVSLSDVLLEEDI